LARSHAHTTHTHTHTHAHTHTQTHTHTHTHMTLHETQVRDALLDPETVERLQAVRRWVEQPGAPFPPAPLDKDVPRPSYGTVCVCVCLCMCVCVCVHNNIFATGIGHLVFFILLVCEEWRLKVESREKSLCSQYW